MPFIPLKRRKTALYKRRKRFAYLLSLFSHGWLVTPHDVLQADWQDVWHSPQPPSFRLFVKSRVLIVIILFIMDNSSKQTLPGLSPAGAPQARCQYFLKRLSHAGGFVN